MGKNITIQTDGTATAYTNVKRIRTKNLSNQSTLWVPVDETTLGELTVNVNGTYVAEDMGYYGFSQVVSNVPNTVTGKKNGISYSVEVDGSGFLRYTVVD